MGKTQSLNIGLIRRQQQQNKVSVYKTCVPGFQSGRDVGARIVSQAVRGRGNTAVLSSKVRLKTGSAAFNVRLILYPWIIL